MTEKTTKELINEKKLASEELENTRKAYNKAIEAKEDARIKYNTAYQKVIKIRHLLLKMK